MCGLQPATDQRTPVSRPPPPTQPHRSHTPPPLLRNDVKDKNTEIDTRNNCPKKKILKIGHVAKYNKCQGYRHLTVDYTSPVKITIINGVSTVTP